MGTKGQRQQQKVYAYRQCNYKPCAKVFIPKRVDMVFCSAECKKAHYQEAYKIGLKCQAGKCRFYPKEAT